MFQQSAGSTVSVHSAAASENLGSTQAAVTTPVLHLQKTQNYGAFAANWGSTFTLVTATSTPSMWARWGV
jgi:hypothetical protein